MAIKPTVLYRSGKKLSVHVRMFATVSVVTDARGVADSTGCPEEAGSCGLRSCRAGATRVPIRSSMIRADQQIAAHVLRSTRLSGTVHFPIGARHRQVLVRAND